jgi:hypothetical protein
MVGKQHGMGTMKYPDGRIEEGFWLEKKIIACSRRYLV